MDKDNLFIKPLEDKLIRRTFIQTLGIGTEDTLPQDIERAKETHKLRSERGWITQALLHFTPRRTVEVIGLISYTIEPTFIFEDHRVCHISGVIVRKDCRGNGYGTMLMKHVETLVPKEQCFHIKTFSGTYKRFYRSLGYTTYEDAMQKYLK